MQLDCAKAVAWPLPTRLSELSREFASYFLMLKGKQTTTAFEALWRSTVGRMAVVHAFLSVLRVICDPRAIAPGNADGTAALASGPTEKGLYKPTKAGSTANAIPGRANEICAGAAGILCRLFLRATGPQDSDLPIHICASIPAAAAEMVEELLRGGCLPMLSRVLASGPSASSGAPGFADSPKAGGTPCHFKAAADGATLVFNMVYSMVLVGVSQPRTRRLVLSPQLPACRLVERWAYAAANEASGPPRISHNNNHQLPPTDQESLDLNIRLLLSHHKPCKTQSMAHVMRSSMWLLLPALLWQRSDGGEPLRAVLSGPCLQYLVALQAVSQLHAADGGTLYGLPPAAVLPPELAEVEGRGQGPAVLCCDVLRKCVDFWESCVTGQPRVSLGPLRNRCLVNLCMRLSRVALASLEDAEATAAQPQTRKGGRSLQGQQQQRQRGQVGAEAGSNCSGGPPPASGVASVALRRPLEAGTCMSVALQSLRLAAATLRSMDAISSRGSSSAGGDGGTDGEDPSTASSCRSSLGGSSSTGSTSTSTSTSGAEASSSMLAAPPTSTDGGSSPRVAVADSSADTSPVAPEPSADPRLCSRSFGRRWWPLAVGAVRAALRHPGGMKEETLSTCCEVLRVSSEPQVWDPEQGTADWYKQVLELARTERQNLQEEDLEGSAAATEGDKLPARADLISLSTIPPGLAVALSAGLLPTLTAMARSSCGAASGSVDAIDLASTPMDPIYATVRLAKSYSVAYGGELLKLLSRADPAQAAALLTALADAPLALLPVEGTRMTEVQVGTTSAMMMNFSSAFSGLVSGLLPPEETRWGNCAWDRRSGRAGTAGTAEAARQRRQWRRWRPRAGSCCGWRPLCCTRGCRCSRACMTLRQSWSRT